MRVVIRGIVQGVGFRPAMHRLAVSHRLGGFVGNDGTGVFVEVEGDPTDVAAFLDAVPASSPPLALIDGIEVTERPSRGDSRFLIVESDAAVPVATLLSPDIAPCVDCLAELADPDDRRHRYPFVNCTNCGPRYSIVRRLPYDRATTTMAGFAMCDECAREYHDPTDRRFHAQPTCCPRCGPRLSLRDRDGRVVGTGSEVVAAVIERLGRGEIVAVKGLGGYHLAVDASDEDAVARLRARKQREDKPFALLVVDLDMAGAVADVGPAEADLLVDPSRTIVLLDRRADAPVAPSVAPGNRSLGVLLPPTPLHVLLARGFAGPLVLTSGNRSHEPMAVDDDEAVDRLGGIADAFCTHDRPIHVRVDDSVARVVGDRQIVLRRARGHAPRPVRLAGGFPRHTLACGALLKSTVCLGRDEHAFVSQHIGDLDDHDTFREFTRTIDHLAALFDIHPEVVAHDLHPELPSTIHARLLAERGLETVAVQHHHAHIAACLADNEVEREVIGIAFDGFGHGTDGAAWGGEVLHADLVGFERLGHLATVPLPGGDAAAREPWRMAAVHLARAAELGEVDPASLAVLDVHARNDERWAAVLSMAAAGVNAPPTSSAGRLFDAIASLAGVRDVVTYEGQAAIELEQVVALDETGAYRIAVIEAPGSGSRPFVLDPAPMIAGVVDDLAAGAPVGLIAARFHNAVVGLVADAANRARALTGSTVVALSGGVFQNAVLVRRGVARLEADGFEVLTHRRFPANDGGISLGQAAVVAAMDRRARPSRPVR